MSTSNPSTQPGSPAAAGSAGAYEPATGAGRTVAHPEHPEIHNRRDDGDSARIQNDIDHTRSEMDRTLDVLKDRLRPSSLIDTAIGYMSNKVMQPSGQETYQPGRPLAGKSRDEALTRAGKNAAGFAWDKVKENPIAATGIAASLAWLFLKPRDDDRDVARDAFYAGRDRLSGEQAERERLRMMTRGSREPEMYAGSYVDARTGQPYDVEHYGDEYQGGGQHRGDRSGRGGQDQGPGLASKAASGVASAASSAASGMASAASWVAGKSADLASTTGHAIVDAVSSTGEFVWEGATVAFDKAGDLVDATGNVVAKAGSDTAERARRARDLSISATRRAQESSAAYGRQGYDAGREYGQRGLDLSRRGYESGVENHPLAMAAGALAAGVLAGLVVPRTRPEDRLMGGQSRELKDQAGDLAHEMYERGQTVAGRVYDETKDEAQSQGLTPDSLKRQASDLTDKAKQAAGRLVDSAVESVERVVDEATAEAGNVADEAKREAQGVKEDAKDKSLTPSGIADAAKSVAEKAVDTAKDESSKQVDKAKEKHDLKS